MAKVHIGDVILNLYASENNPHKIGIVNNIDKDMFIKVSNSSIKRCREKFPYKGIGKVINSAIQLFDKVSVEIVISEFIYDSDDFKLYNVLLYLIRENCTDEQIIDELKSFKYE